MDNQQPAVEPVEQDVAAASDADRETESGLMNRLIRGVGGIFGRVSDPSAEPEEQAAASEATPEPDKVVLTRAELDAREREWQSRKDREVAQTRVQLTREHAREQAEQGNLEPVRRLAEQGDRWAHNALVESGDAWTLGENEIKRAQAEQAAESVGAQVTGVALHFDQAYLEPLLAALPDQAEAARLRAATIGIDGRAQTTQTVLKSLEQHWKAEGVRTALDDETFVKSLFGSEAFRRALVASPVPNKQLRALFRGDLNEPDLNPGSGPGRGGDTESAVMNDAIRDAWRGADARAPIERAAGAGSSNGRGAHRDTLGDD